MADSRPSITPEQELALLLAGTATSRVARSARAKTLAGRVDFATLEALLRGQGMLWLIGHRLEDLSPEDVPVEFGEHLDEYAHAARRQGLSQQMLTVRLIAALEEEGVRVLPLKGPLLGERLYGDVGARVSTDIDLLVAASDLARASDIVIGLGYEKGWHVSTSARDDALHERLVHPLGLPEVEMHWRMHWYEQRFSVDLLLRSERSTDGLLQPNVCDELAELLLLYARDGFAGLRLLSDIAAWWDRYGDDLEPADLVRTVDEYPALGRSLATAALLAERLVGLPARHLLPSGTLSGASRGAMRLANWPLRGDAGQISANVSLVDWALAPTGQRRALVRRYLLLSDEDLRLRWPDAASSPLGLVWLRTGLRAVHALGVLWHCAITWWMLATRQSWAPLPSSVDDLSFDAASSAAAGR